MFNGYNILQPSKNTEIVNCYESEFLSLRAYQDYRVINLWEVEAKAVFEQSLRYLLPFVPIMKGGEEEVTVRKALQLLREDGELLEFENLLAFFATFVLNTKIVQQIMRWDMAVLEQSPWYQQILQEGMQRGILSGIELGLELKFGSSGKEIFSEINTIENIQVLETILASIKTVETIEELRQVYQSHS